MRPMKTSSTKIAYCKINGNKTTILNCRARSSFWAIIFRSHQLQHVQKVILFVSLFSSNIFHRNFAGGSILADGWFCFSRWITPNILLFVANVTTEKCIYKMINARKFESRRCFFCWTYTLFSEKTPANDDGTNELYFVCLAGVALELLLFWDEPLLLPPVSESNDNFRFTRFGLAINVSELDEADRELYSLWSLGITGVFESEFFTKFSMHRRRLCCLFVSFGVLCIE